MKNIRNIIEQKYPPENPNDLWMKDNVLYKSTHKGWTPLTAGGGSSTNGVTSTTWLELKDKRDAGKLTPGTLYRITDYNCTTTQENTQSAGHQFDIVLLALSENKLAEEGWAMMNESNIYDVTFSDGVTKKCYLYEIDRGYHVIDISTLLGYAEDNIEINETNKTAITDNPTDDLITPNLTYNYFQNSNLSAWKVWYCLDNDKSRFAWADDSVDVTTEESLTITIRNKKSIAVRVSSQDVLGTAHPYAWSYDNGNSLCFTTNAIPNVDEKAYTATDARAQILGTIVSYTPAHEGTGLPNGRGVIYRLIDEWNNDCPYDFKNILYLRQLTAGVIDAQGTDTYIPTFCLYDIGNTEYRDASIFAIYYPSDENIIGACYDNIIKMVNTSDIEECYAFKLPNNIILELVETGDTSWQTHSNIIFAKSCSFCAMINSNVIYASEKTYTHIPSGIIFGNKQVVWENIS